MYQSTQHLYLEEGIKQNHFVVSDTKAHAAWLIKSGDDAGKIREIEFDSLKTRDISPESGKNLRALGFMNEDLVYGILSDEDILTDANGHETEGISTFRIESFKGKVKKEYRQDGLYITNVTVGSTMMEFEAFRKIRECLYSPEKGQYHE